MRRRGCLRRALLAEGAGTYLIVQLGTAAVMSAVFGNGQGLAAAAGGGVFPIAAVSAAGVTVAIRGTARLSGAHLNPAISIATAALRPSPAFHWAMVAPYAAAQLAGAVAGSATNFFLYRPLIRQYEAVNGIVRSSAGATASAKAFGEYFSAPVTTAQAFFAEAFGTAILAAVIFALTHPKNDAVADKTSAASVPPLIGATVGALICVLAPLTQAGLNPARDFGPRIVAYLAGYTKVAFAGAWVYVVAPILGAMVGAALVDKFLYRSDDEAQ